MKTKITLLVLTALLGLTNVFANSMPTSENVVENEIMTTGDNSIIISAGKRIYTLDMNTYQATLLATSPYVNEINSIASDNRTGWVFYVSNHISSYNWTIYGYNVYTNTHKNFGSVRHFFTQTGHAYSSRGLASGGATFYNGKLYFAMEYPVRCYYHRDGGRGNATNANPKDELINNPRSLGTVTFGTITNSPVTVTRGIGTEADETQDNGGRSGNGEAPADFVVLDTDEANIINDNVSDYIPEEELPSEDGSTNDDGLQQRGYSAESYSYNYYNSSYNNNMYLLEISFNGLSDASGQTAAVSNGTPVYDNWWYSSFLYKGELGDIVVDDNGQLYAATSYQVQAYNFNSNRYDWANNEDIYAQMAKDKNSALQLLKNKKVYSSYYYHGCPQNSYTVKSYVQSYTAPSSLRTYNNIQLGSLNEISGLNSSDVGQITDASDYIRLTPPVSYKIKGTVFDDNDEDGNFDSSTDGRLENVVVTLYADNNADGLLDSGDTVINTRNTNANGWYSFNNVQTANTIVAVTRPSDSNTITYTATTPEVVAVTGSTNDVRVDFGINKELILVNYDIFGTVYDDNNENASLENGEAGLDNVTLTLYADNNADGILDSGDSVITTTVSGTDGSYSFIHVCIQNTIVAVTVPTNNGNFTYTLTTAGTQAIDSINTNVNDVDFGINQEQVINYNISGTVFDDDNANGVNDTETGLDAVTVTLYADVNNDGALDAGDTVISSTNTAAGAYSFANITVENTIVAVTVPGDTSDFTYTLTTAGTLAASSTTADVNGLDFGINQVQVIDYNISGTVFDDDNGNGVNDTEAGLDAVTVTLYADVNNDGALDAGDTVITSTNTGVNGAYNFVNITVENTVVAVTVPTNTANFTYALTTAGTLAASSTTADVNGLDFGINQVQVIDYNISGNVYDDNDESGAQDVGEDNLEAITVTLYADNNNNGIVDAGDTVIATDTSAAVDGTYNFSNVTVQNTVVAVTVPGNTPDFTYTLTTAGELNTSSTITDVTGINFGINQVQVIDYNISGNVYDDNDESGAQDVGEDNLEAITVTLYADANANGIVDAGDTVITSAISAIDGTYSFSNVTVQNTVVAVTVPTNTGDFTYTLTTAGELNTSSTITDVTGINFGINEVQIIDYTISGTVFDDNNENGVQDAGDGVLDGINVTLYADNNADGVLDVADTTLTSTTTAVDGTYSFTNITTANVLAVVTTPGNTTTFTYVLTTSNTQAAASTTADVTGLDFGINEVKVINYDISGTVFDDNDGDGIKGVGEGSVGPVTVTLYADNNNNGIVDAGDTVIETTVTNSMSGNYNFINVVVENTIVSVTVPTDTAAFTYTLTTPGSQDTTSVLTDVTGVDFGIDRVQVINYNISGTVFDDDNENGTLDSAENFLRGVTVTLYADTDNNGRVGSVDTVIATTSSASDGTYGFAAVTEPNTLVAVTVPTDNTSFTYVLTSAATVVTDSTIADVTDVNFGINRNIAVNYNIDGFVWDDDNEDGAPDTTVEGFLENVTVTLYADNDNNGRVGSADTVISSTTTAVDGTYSFVNVTEAATLVQVQVPGNTTDYVYTLTTGRQFVTNSVNTDVTGINFGINQQAATYSIAGVVFDDDNENGLRDSEGGLSNIPVRLYEDLNQNGRIDRGEPLLLETVTDRNGNYQFVGLTDIFVVIQAAVPARTPTFQYTPTTPVSVGLSSGISTTVNFGINRELIVLYNISGLVWDDDNADQVKDPAELVLSNINVTLYEDTNANGIVDAGENAIVTVPTSSTGTYTFTGVNVSSVVVEPVLPSNGTYTTPGTIAITSVNNDITNANFGIDITANLFQVTGVIFDDDNRNGVADPGEGSINGLTIEIYVDTDGSGTFDSNLDALVAFTQSSNGIFDFANPNYVVNDVPDEQVFIRVVIPAGNPPLLTYTPTFDPDSGTVNPDGIFPTIMTGNISGVNFGIDVIDFIGTPRNASMDTGLITNDENVLNTTAEPVDVSSRLRLYPNPTVREIRINSEEFLGDVTVEIYNDRGYKVMTTTASSFGGELKVDVQRLRPGMYYAKFGSRNKVANKKFVKR
ncbi:SdrD B-like domain-containing protein [uncultured Kordia sp.]|uniref:SdrD B-like domain-containing protein n=1 Tax=uncultured Kordia sp. TaxID=507699 RepID=UPI00262138D8|nr:SdrD B-like domain-containing protein [uncultured Kordia sp.]